MSKILYIKANPKNDDSSSTFKLADTFLEEYKANNPDDEVIVVDLYKENVRPLDGEMIDGIFSGADNEVKRHAKLFAEADKYVFAAPMWNLSIPAILKAYIDYVSYAGITFKYTENGPVGLLADRPRKAIHIVTRGGMYSEGPAKEYELGDKYLRTILGFLGVYDVETLALENVNVLQGEDLRKAIETAHNEARELGKKF